LACWRAAELRQHGERARVLVKQVKPRLFHVVVLRQDGTIEDPSKRLGMKGAG